MVNCNKGCTSNGIRIYKWRYRLNAFLKFALIITITFANLFTGQMGADAAMNVTVVPAVPNTDTQVSIKWTSVAGASYYDIYRDGENVHTIDVNKDLNYTSYVDTGLTPETTYNYEVRALNSQGGELDRGSASVTTSKMLAPSNLTAVFDVNSRKITLKWVNKSAAVASSVIKTIDGDIVHTVEDNSNECTIDGPGPDDNTPLKYVVMSIDGAGHNSPDSNIVVVTPIQQPTISAVMANGTATISWGSYPHITNFSLERSRWDSAGWSEWVAVYTSLAGGSIKDTPSEAGSYRYRLAAKTGSGYKGYSNVSDMVSKPAAPSNLRCNILSSNQIEITWENEPDNICELRVQRRTGSSGAYTTVAVLDSSEQAYVDTYDFTLNTTYYYRIVAFDSDNNVSASAECPVKVSAPNPPSNLRLTVESSTQIRLDWNNTETSILFSGFKIERRTGTGGNFEEIGTVSSDTTTFTDNTVSGGQTYTYRVRSYNVIGNSAYSNEVSTDTTLIASPSSLTVIPVSSSQIELNWTYPNSERYRTVIERKTGTDGKWTIITTAPLAAGVLKYVDSGLSANTLYFYRVRAVSPSNSYVYSKPYPDNDTGEGCYTMLGAVTLYGSVLPSNTIYLYWNSGSGGSEYVIERKVADGNFAVVATVSSSTTSWYDTNLVPNVLYTYRVKYKSYDNESVYSNELAIANIYLDAPSNLTASVNADSEIELTWTDNSLNETGFEIWRYEYISGSSNNYNLYSVVGQNVRNFVDKNVQPGIQYRYMVRAYDAERNIYSSYSNTASAGVGIINPPDRLDYTVVSQTQITLTWRDNSSNESGFKIERKIGADGIWTEIATLPANTTSYSNVGLVPYVQYFYRIKAYDYSHSNNSYSNEIEVSTGIPYAPKNLVVEAVSSRQINLSWTDNSTNEQGFRIERRRSGEASFSLVATVGAGVTNYRDTGLNPETVYYYRVAAYNKSGREYSNTASTSTKKNVTFTDLGSVSWARNAIEDLASRGIVAGKSENLFKPNDKITRAEFTCLMVRAFNLEMTPVGSFADVKIGKWYYKDLMTAKSLGIISGDEKNCFYPEDPITREDMAVIIAKTLKAVNKPLTGFSNSVLEKFRDKNMISPYALSSIASLHGEGIMLGKTSSTIAPKDNATRAEAAVLINKVIDR